MADDVQQAPTTDPVPTPAQLAAAAPDPVPAPAVDPTPAPAPAPAVDPTPAPVPAPTTVATADDQAVHPDLVAHSSGLIDYVNTELARHKALLAVVTDAKKGINDLHTDLVTAGEAVVAAEKKVHGFTVEHKLKIALVVIVLTAVGYAVFKFL